MHDEVIAIAAEWSDPAARGRKKLQPLTEGEKDNVLQLLEDSLASPRLQKANETVKELLKQNAAQDIADLIPHLERRAKVLAQRAEKKLTERGQKEAAEMKKILEQQRDRITQRQKEIEAIEGVQLTIPFAEFPVEEQRQLEADSRHWEKRLKALAEELQTEPTRIEASYQVRAVRVEPVGLVYLWSVSG